MSHDCEHVTRQLLELPTDDFDQLAAHLERCPRCAALADRIATQEDHMTAFVDDYAHAPTFDEALTAAHAAAPPRRRPWPVMAAAVALAAVATLWLAAVPPVAPEGPDNATQPSAAAPPTDNVPVLRLGVGRSVLLEPAFALETVSVVDPAVVRVVQAGDGLLSVQAVGVGRSQLHVTGEGQRDAWWLEVHADSDASVEADDEAVVVVPTRRVQMRKGERRVVELGLTPLAVSVTEPGLVQAAMDPAGPRQLAVSALGVGTTDLLVRGQQGSEMWILQVVP